MATRYAQTRAKFVDCQAHGPGSGAELFLVEGDSAASSVLAVRDERCQAVLPLQGKPLNAWAATPAKVAQHVLFKQLAQSLGLAQPTVCPDSAVLRFERVLLLFDPDADGIHIGALMVLYFQRWLPQLIGGGHLWLARAPMFEIEVPGLPHHYAYNPPQCQQMADRLRSQAAGAEVRVRAFRGLGSLAPELLRERCLDPATRMAHAVGAADVQAVVDVFGGAV
jgi:DNA gyrase subunit B